jgi:SET domain-containing protein
MNESCRLSVRGTEKGKAVYAGSPIRNGEYICEFTGQFYTMAEYLKLHDPGNNHFLQIEEDLFMGPSGGADDLINHSCNPNCGLVYRDGHVKLIAIADIRKDDELTFDYSTTMDEDCWEMDCLCGEPNCRGKVRDFKYLPGDLQKKYIALGVVMPYIVKRTGRSR